MSPGFLFSEKAEVSFIKREANVAIQYESWLSFQFVLIQGNKKRVFESQSSMSPGFLFSILVAVNRIGYDLKSQSSMSPGFLFSSWGERCNCGSQIVAIQYESWLSFQ